MVLKRFLIPLGIVVLIIFFSIKVYISRQSAFSSKSKLEKSINTYQQSNSDENSFVQTLTDIDKPMNIDLSIFAPFFYWSSVDENRLVLKQFTKDNKEIIYKSIEKQINKNDPQGRIIKEEKVSRNRDKLAFITEKIEDNIKYEVVEIFDTKTESISTYENRANDELSSGLVIYRDSWSPNDKYFYYLFSGEYEKDYNIWVINLNNKSSKILLNGYGIHILGWINDNQLAFYKQPKSGQKELNIYSVDVRNSNTKKIGFCDSSWLNRCLRTNFAFPEDGILFSENSNTTNIYLYNYQDQSELLINDILHEEQFVHAHINAFSPDKGYMYFYIQKNYANQQPEKAGTYEYNLSGEYFRHISKDEYLYILWGDSSDRKGSTILLKGKGYNENKYYLHPIDSFDIHPVEIPEKIIEFIN